MFSRARFTWLTVLPPLTVALVLVMAICSALYWREADQIKESALDREARRMEIFAGLFNGDVSSSLTDLRQLATGDGFQAYLLSGQLSDLDRAIRRAKFSSTENADYDQIRFLDERGRELFRVNANGAVVPQDQLQDKSNRPYFQKAWNLGRGQVYVSSLDLNIEGGVVEKPLKPMLRLAMPIFDGNGQKRGVYVINILAGNLISRLEQFVPQYQQRLRLLNPRGYWLKAAQPEEEWGFTLPGRADMTLASSDPRLWASILKTPSGQVPHDGGYFSWYRSYPSGMVKGRPITLVSGDDFIIFASEISASEWAALFARLKQTFVVVGVILFVLATVICWFFQVHLRTQMERDRFFSLSRDLLCVAGFDGYFKRVNPAWEEALGYTRKDLISKPFLDFVHPDDREKTIAETARLIRGEETVLFENRYRCRNGTYRWLLWSARSLVDEKIIFGSARDLTDRRNIEDHVLQLNGELKHRAELLEAANKELESFSYSVSHDLRAPLRHIHGFVELLQKSPAVMAEEVNRRYMDIISRAAKEMGHLIDDLLAFSRTGRTDMHPRRVDMEDIVNQIIASREVDYQGRRVTWQVNPLAKVACDPKLIRLVWTNLLDNALKYTRPRDEAKIEIGQMENSEGSADGMQLAVFYVRDNGVGFDMQYVSKLFGVFQRLHRAEDFEGTGIGLANVQRIVRRHGGCVWAEAKVDHGATFYFSLPITPSDST